MTVDQLIVMAQRRIAHLNEARIASERIGDVDAVARIDSDIAETQATLTKLQTLV
jgi:hypothetical protein